MTFGTLFSGCECVAVGFMAAGLTPVWHCEWDKRPSAVLRYRFPNTPNFGDVAEFPSDSVELPDVVWMSPPCQDISIIGKQAGLHGEKSKFFFDAVRAIRGLRDRGWRGILCMEQVQNILVADDGRGFSTVLRELWQLGAHDIGWRVFNARYCGVPQSRRRVFIVADYGAERSWQILCDYRPGQLRTEKGRIQGVEYPAGDTPPALVTQHSRATGAAASLAICARSPERYARPEGLVIAPCLDTRRPMRGTNKPGHLVVETAPCIMAGQPVGKTSRGGYPIIAACLGTYNPTRMGGNKTFPITHEKSLRWRTPREHERLMGLPDDWTRWGINEKGQQIEMSDAARYHMTGNGVVAPIAEHLGLNILEASNP